MSRAGLLSMGVAAVILIGGCSKSDRKETAQPTGRAVGTGGAGANLKNDDDFVREIALMNMTEIELSRIALDKATSSEVKFFAQRMVDDHSAAGNTLKSVLSQHPMDWPNQLDEKHKKTADELATKHGDDFDREYVKAMIESHQNFAAKLESRLDVQSLADWKTAAAGRAESNTLPDPKTEMRDVAVRPAKSDNDVTMRINQWAAETYPVAQKHLDTARALENATKKRSTT